jgi:hypothetical protein
MISLKGSNIQRYTIEAFSHPAQNLGSSADYTVNHNLNTFNLQVDLFHLMSDSVTTRLVYDANLQSNNTHGYEVYKINENSVTLKIYRIDGGTCTVWGFLTKIA